MGWLCFGGSQGTLSRRRAFAGRASPGKHGQRSGSHRGGQAAHGRQGWGGREAEARPPPCPAAPRQRQPGQPPLRPAAAGRRQRTGDAGAGPAPAEGGGREELQPGGASPLEAASAQGWGPVAVPTRTPLGAAIPSPFPAQGRFLSSLSQGLACPVSLASSSIGPSPGVAGHGLKEWELPCLLASKAARGTCSRVPFSGPAFVGANCSHISATRQGESV